MNDDDISAAAALWRSAPCEAYVLRALEEAKARAGEAKDGGGAGRTGAAPRSPLYVPRPLQAELHRDPARFKVIVAHRRFGKTLFALNELLRDAGRTDLSDARFAYLAPFERQAKAVAWDHLKRQAAGHGGARFHETELRCDFDNGARVSLYGADNPDALRGLYLDGAVLDEYARMDPRAWTEVIRPALTDRGGWAVFIGTPMGRNSLWRLFERAKSAPGWRAALFPASETGVLPAAELAAARAAMGEAEYAQEFECSFDAAIRGAYFGPAIARAEAEGRVRRVPHEPLRPVDTAWDLGIGDATAIWFCQRVGGEIRLIDYHEAAGVGLDHHAAVLRAKGYAYGEHILPHDAEARELGSGKSRVEMLTALGFRPRVLPLSKLPDGIEQARALLARCWFDAERCAKGLEALRHYRAEWDERLGTTRERPRHDWASHGADAFRYLAMGLREEARPQPPIVYDNRAIV
jgi:hypothetical protein